MTNDVEHLLMAYKPLRVKSPSRKVVELGLKARIYTQVTLSEVDQVRNFERLCTKQGADCWHVGDMK